ncbi:MAG: hypothetical protein PVJ60_04280 [Phycisphaerales bacterium]|jgi:glutathione synthase/RimK-type ligase-like ATP-grasp enzyme
MDNLVHKFFLWAKHYDIAPEWIARFVLKHTNMLDLRKANWVAKDPHVDAPLVSSYPSKYPYVIGIIKEFCHMHSYYVAACRDLGVSYKVVDISGPNWLEDVEQSDCDAFLVRPSGLASIWKQMYDERLRVIAKDLGKMIFPSYEAIWFYESKRRMHYWLKAHDIPHPKTWIFYDFNQAIDFVEQAVLPIVYKSDFGSGAFGVKIFRDRNALRRHVKRCFKKGCRSYTRCVNDKEWGSVFLQEYLPDVKEWRIIRLGDSYLGYEKLKKGDFHSGSHMWRYGRPSAQLLDFTRYVTNKESFTSMSVDVFITSDGRYLVNELQSLFGVFGLEPQCVVNGKPGRMRWDSKTISWQFQEGSFADNKCCNLRVKILLQQLTEAAKLVSSL